MQYVNHIQTPHSLVIMFDKGAPVTVTDKKVRNRVLGLIRSSNFSEIANVATAKGRIEHGSKGRFRVVKGRVVIKGEHLPEALSRRLIQLVNVGASTKPLQAFWENLRKNPRADSKEDLYKFLEANHVPITPDGYFIAYRKVRSNFKDGHTGTMDNSPGRTVKMPRKDVDPNRNNSCSTGLHVAGFGYAQSFSGSILLDVKVNPRDVVTVPTEYKNDKIRVCRFQVLGVHEREVEYKEQVLRKKIEANTVTLAGRKRGKTTFVPVTKEALELLLTGDGRKPISVVVTDARSRFVLVTREVPKKTKFSKTFKRGQQIFATKEALETAKIGGFSEYIAKKTKTGMEIRPIKPEDN
jgi:hypothetical protein